MAKTDYIPSRDAAFLNWLAGFSAYVAANYASLGLTLDQSDALSGDYNDFKNAYDAHLAETLIAKSKRQTKSSTRKTSETTTRQLVKLIQARPGLTDAQRDAMGITVPDREKTRVPVPTTHPVPQIKEIESFEHVLAITDSESDSRSKPDGVRGAEVYLKIVAPGQPAPVDPSELTLVDVASASKLTQSFSGDQANQTAYYRMRWVNTRNEKGPWGPQVSATIAA